jgi:hypothetical protein
VVAWSPAIISSVTRRKPQSVRTGQFLSGDPDIGREPAIPRSATAVLLPGSGSDAVFVRRAFAGPLAAFGIAVHAVRPTPGVDPATGYRRALDAVAGRALARPGRSLLLVGGISLGAHVAAGWTAEQHRDRRPDGLLLALPAWHGPPGDAPAAMAARLTAARVRAGGTAAAVAAAREGGAPGWLVAELERAWAGYGDRLADALDAAAASPAPDPAALAGIAVPTGIAAVRDDPVHPHAEARTWAAALPAAAVVAASFAAFGADPQVLGRAALLGWLRATARS